MKTLPISIDKIGFVTREEIDGRIVSNRCGRDFLYYGLNYFEPEEYNPQKNNPGEIERNRLFGYKTGSLFAWTQLQFVAVPKILKKHNLELSINGRPVNNFRDFVASILYSRCSYSLAIKIAKKAVDDGKVAGIDISMGKGGLLDHVMFVYGYDDANLYICDTHKAEGLLYEHIGEGEKYLMRLSNDEIRKRWTKFGRVWIMERLYVPTQAILE